MISRQNIIDNLRALRFQFFAAALILMILVIAIVLYIRFYTLDTMREQVAQTNAEVISLYLRSIDNSLSNNSKSMANFILDDPAFAAFKSAQDPSEQAFALPNLINRMRTVLITNEIGDAIFMFRPEDHLYIFANRNGVITQEVRQLNGRIQRMIVQIDLQVTPLNQWSTFMLDGKGYLLRLLEIDGIFIGTWVNIENLPTPTEFSQFSDSKLTIFLGDDGQVLLNEPFVSEHQIDLSGNYRQYYLSKGPSPYLVIGKHSDEGNFALIVATNDQDLQRQFPYIEQIILLFSLSIALYLIIYTLFMNRKMLIPMKKLTNAMKMASSGRQDIHLSTDHVSTEFKTINATFNKMIVQIHDLKIDVYEEKITRQKSELEQLKLQVNPHFFMNSLNIIYTLAKSGKHALIMEMSMHLVHYFRYMFSNRTDFVPLRQELDHVRNYLAIQQLRFPDKLEYDIESPPFLADFPLPPLSIHTFVENSIKYAGTAGAKLVIKIKVELIEGQAANWLRITTSDNGVGFSPAVLQAINAGQLLHNGETEQIGISNIKNRLAILYDGKASLTCSNQAGGGATCKILIQLEGGERLDECTDR